MNVNNYHELVAAIDAIVEDMYSGHAASAAKRGRNPKFPYVPLLKITDREANRTRTENPTRNRAYATREEAIAVAQRILDSDKAARKHQILKPNYGMPERTYRGLPRDIDAIMAEVGKLTAPEGARVVMIWGKHRGEIGTVTLLMDHGRSHCIKLDNGAFLDGVEAVDFELAYGMQVSA
jgi:hypothetical protein